MTQVDPQRLERQGRKAVNRVRAPLCRVSRDCDYGYEGSSGYEIEIGCEIEIEIGVECGKHW
jgi:hypothetical protein